VIPAVHLSNEHELLCKVRVGDAMPVITLGQLGGREMELARLYGKTATVVAFWHGEGRMSRTLIADLGPDVLGPFGEKGVTVIGIAVKQPAEIVSAALERAEARYPNLLDPEGRAYALVGKEKLPRVYLLDALGRIRWFDIEYSLATRRELSEALRAVTALQKSE
jgi:peroxiredoxin